MKVSIVRGKGRNTQVVSSSKTKGQSSNFITPREDNTTMKVSISNKSEDTKEVEVKKSPLDLIRSEKSSLKVSVVKPEEEVEKVKVSSVYGEMKNTEDIKEEEKQEEVTAPVEDKNENVSMEDSPEVDEVYKPKETKPVKKAPAKKSAEQKTTTSRKKETPKKKEVEEEPEFELVPRQKKSRAKSNADIESEY